MSVNPVVPCSVRRGAFVVRLGACLIAWLSAASGAASAAPERYALDPAHTAVVFLVDHIGYAKAIGRFAEVSGEFAHDADTGAVTALRVVIATASVDTGDAARDAHLRKADFLDVGSHPEMVFEADAVVPGAADAAAPATGTLEGTLTLLGRSRPVALDYTLNKAAEYPFGHGDFTLGVSLRGTLARSDWGMDYGVANALVGDDVELLIEVEANRRR